VEKITGEEGEGDKCMNLCITNEERDWIEFSMSIAPVSTNLVLCKLKTSQMTKLKRQENVLHVYSEVHFTLCMVILICIICLFVSSVFGNFI
jgi:hypothetical protein